MVKQLARLAEAQGGVFVRRMEEINEIARRGGLKECRTYSRIWEYPWVSFQLDPLRDRHLTVLDVGSQKSALPWFLARRGFRVTASDVSAGQWRTWLAANRRLGAGVHRRILDGCGLDLEAASVDVYLSVSVVEHVRNKEKVFAEAARVLKPGGLLVMTFDVCEPELGMSFPEWNGRAFTMREFDRLFAGLPWFDAGVAGLRWNTEDIPDFLAWHRTTAPHHAYVTGGAVVRRNHRPWAEPRWRGAVRAVRAKARAAAAFSLGFLRYAAGGAKRALGG